jgi:hypothetical protein
VNIPSTADTFSFQLSVTWRDASGAVIGTTPVKTYTGSTGSTWDQAQATLTAPAGTTKAQVRMIAKGLSATVYVDDFGFLRSE